MSTRWTVSKRSAGGVSLLMSLLLIPPIPPRRRRPPLMLPQLPFGQRHRPGHLPRHRHQRPVSLRRIQLARAHPVAIRQRAHDERVEGAVTLRAFCAGPMRNRPRTSARRCSRVRQSVRATIRRTCTASPTGRRYANARSSSASRSPTRSPQIGRRITGPVLTVGIPFTEPLWSSQTLDPLEQPKGNYAMRMNTLLQTAPRVIKGWGITPAAARTGVRSVYSSRTASATRPIS